MILLKLPRKYFSVDFTFKTSQWDFQIVTFGLNLIYDSTWFNHGFVVILGQSCWDVFMFTKPRNGCDIHLKVNHNLSSDVFEFVTSTVKTLLRLLDVLYNTPNFELTMSGLEQKLLLVFVEKSKDVEAYLRNWFCPH